MTLKGPVGEDNRLRFLPRGTILGIANSIPEALHQFGAALATGNRFLLQDNEAARRLLDGLPKPLRARIASAAAWETSSFDAVLMSDEARVQRDRAKPWRVARPDHPDSIMGIRSTALRCS